MATLQQIRKQYPQYDDLSDKELVNSFHSKFYSDVPVEEFYQKVGYSPMSRSEAAFTTFTNPLGFGDEIKGALSAAVAKPFGGRATKDIPIEELYREARDTERQKQRQAEDEYPVQSFFTGIAGDIGPVGKLLKGAKIANIGSRTKQVVAGGGLSGAALGLGQTEDISDIGETLKDVGTGAAAGAAIAPVADVAIRGAVKAPGAIKEGARRAKGFIDNLSAQPQERALNALGSVIPAEEAGKLAGRLTNIENQGRQSLLPDIASDEVSGLTRLLAKTSGSKNLINDVFNKRSVTSNKRVANLINNKVSSEAYFGNLDELKAAREVLATPMREIAYKKGSYIPTSSDIKAASYQVTSPRISELKQNPNFLSKNNQRLASDFDEIVTDPRIKKYISTSVKDNEIDAPINSVEMMHDVRKQIDRDLSGLYNSIESYQTNATTAASAQSELYGLQALKKRLNKIIYEVSPEMKEHDKIYADSFALERAQKIGRNFNNEFPTTEELKRFVKDLTPGEKDAFKIGVARNQLSIVGNTRDGASAARKIFSAPENRDKLKVIFNNPKEYADFGKRMNDEIRIFDTKQRILGGSRTDINLADEGEILSKIASGTLKASVAPKTTWFEIARNSIKRVFKGINEATAKELAKIVTDRKLSIEALEKIAQRAPKEERPLVRKAINAIYPIVVGSRIGGAVNESDYKPGPASAEASQVNDALNQRREFQKQVPSSYTQEDLEEIDPITQQRFYE